MVKLLHRQLRIKAYFFHHQPVGRKIQVTELVTFLVSTTVIQYIIFIFANSQRSFSVMYNVSFALFYVQLGYFNSASLLSCPSAPGRKDHQIINFIFYLTNHSLSCINWDSKSQFMCKRTFQTIHIMLVMPLLPISTDKLYSGVSVIYKFET